ncbi:hypothetical protein C7N43_16895 [Sphingobacteriales bacterium UPWRP_1]|nr:hypothetical protein BVG80_12130 [Sphingobacteriales bacterium TSM_CSM]PSJ75841.1 hypothetical protein C7N43_16895 [Sphingobacteriales bacterium UPWRP_1]
MLKLLSKSRYLVIIAVAGGFIAATALMIYNTIEVISVVGKLFAVSAGEETGKTGKALVVALIEAIDVYLLATVFYIIALGLFELFVDNRLDLPDWLEINNLDDLKKKLIGVLVLVLGVLFLGQVAQWDGERNLMGLGVGIAGVITALTFFLQYNKSKDTEG